MHNLMKLDEFHSLKTKIGCTGVQLADWLGVKPLTVTRWNTGAIAIPGPVALAMKALAGGFRP